MYEPPLDATKVIVWFSRRFVETGVVCVASCKMCFVLGKLDIVHQWCQMAGPVCREKGREVDYLSEEWLRSDTGSCTLGVPKSLPNRATHS